jgi:hypothetical protein
MMDARNWMPALAGMTALWWSVQAAAEPGFARLYKQQYGYIPSCNACHKDGGGTPVNVYGQQFKEAGMNLAAFAAMAGRDADGDGASNEAEARARANPGSAKSTPADKGDWLDTASLIPKEIQAEFPGVREYLPRDAVLTASDITRAQALGAKLDPRDENTIYVPLIERKPAGTGIIFGGTYDKKPFFLLMTTDRQLKVTRVAPLGGNQPAAVTGSKVFATFKGLSLDQLPAASGAGADAAITEAVKKAGTLVYVRLKNA